MACLYHVKVKGGALRGNKDGSQLACVLLSIPDTKKKQKICDYSVRKGLFSLKHVPDYFVIEQQIQLWYDDDDYCNDDKLSEWYDGYKKRKAQKARIEEELMPIAWHPSKYWD